MEKLKKLLLYGGLDRDTFLLVTSRAQTENHKAVTAFTLLSGTCLVISGLLTSRASVDVRPISYYLVALAFYVLALVNELLQKSWPHFSTALAVGYSFTLLCMGIFIAYSQATERTTMLLPLFTLVALVFCYRPVYLAVLLTVVELGYLFIMRRVQTPELFFVNKVNTLIFSTVGLLSGFYTLKMKYQKYKAEYDSEILLEIDVLTGVHSYLSFKKEFELITQEKIPVTVCSFDINGLKQVNDTKGHQAGDELIRGAADCISEVFGAYGKVYRIGGDEFCALLYRDFDEEALRREFSEVTKAWRSKSVDEMNVAFGLAKLDYSREQTLEGAIYDADSQMYAEKNVYYQTHSRRRDSL